jgi:hypothetical protein
MRAVVALLLLSLVACGKRSKQEPIAAALDKLADTPSKMVLYSLNWGNLPDYQDVYDEKMFHGFIILGKAEITDRKEQRTLLRALARGARENDSAEGTCFLPRHALHIEEGGRSMDFTICFTCLQVEPRGFNNGDHFLVSQSPEAIFEHSVAAHHLPALPK